MQTKKKKTLRERLTPGKKELRYITEAFKKGYTKGVEQTRKQFITENNELKRRIHEEMQRVWILENAVDNLRIQSPNTIVEIPFLRALSKHIQREKDAADWERNRMVDAEYKEK